MNKKQIDMIVKERKIKRILNTQELFRDDKFPTYYVITFPGTEIANLDVISVDTEIKRILGKPRKISKMNKNSLLIQTISEKQGETLMKTSNIAGNPVVSETHRSLNIVKGTVVSETFSQCKIEDLKDRLKEQGVSDIYRVKRREGQELIDTHRYILTFNRTQLPQLVKLTDWHHELVQAYIPPPARCTKCQIFGHFKKWCNRDHDVCVRCGQEGHHGADCLSEYARCVNCNGEHPANSKDCEIYHFRCEVMATMVKQHITHAEAMDIAKEKFRQEGRQYSAVVRRGRNEEQAATQFSQQIDNTQEITNRLSTPPSQENSQLNELHQISDPEPSQTQENQTNGAPPAISKETEEIPTTPEIHENNETSAIQQKTKVPVSKPEQKINKNTNSQKDNSSGVRDKETDRRSRTKEDTEKNRSSSLGPPKKEEKITPKNQVSVRPKSEKSSNKTNIQPQNMELPDSKRKREKSSDKSKSPSNQIKVIRSERKDLSASQPLTYVEPTSNSHISRRGSFNVCLTGEPPPPPPYPPNRNK